MTDTVERVRKIVATHLDLDQEKVMPEANFMDDFGADSLEMVELTMAFEAEFGIDVPDDAADKILTVGDAVKFIEEHRR